MLNAQASFFLLFRSHSASSAALLHLRTTTAEDPIEVYVIAPILATAQIAKRQRNHGQFEGNCPERCSMMTSGNS